MDAPTKDTLRKLSQLADAMARLPTIAAKAYANGIDRNRPIVEAHFTPGNDQRNGWPPLSRNYALAKARGLNKTKRGKASELQTLKTGRKVKIDRNASFQSSTGTVSGIGTMANLPMLVRTGLLRQSVTTPTLHAIAQSGDTAHITFSGLPDYASYLHTGTDGKRHMPKRSPVEPSFEDVILMEDAVRKYLDGISGGSGNFAASGNAIGGRARVVA